MFLKTLTALAGAMTGLALSFAQAQDIAPPGWTISYSSNSLYLTRPDLPDIRVAVVSDVRPELTQEEKFEFIKTFFTERADCPSLAQAETHKSFAGYSATSAGASARCKLISMGHWEKGGLQSAMILNEAVEENKILGGVPTRGVVSDRGHTAEAIHQDIVEFLMTRYQIAESKTPFEQVRAQITVDGLASLYPQEHKPAHLVRLRADNGLDAITHAGLTGAHALLLFPERQEDSRISAFPCMQWDPAMFDPYDTTRTPWHKDNNCERYVWRWKEGDPANGIEIRTLSKSAKWFSEHFTLENDEKKKLSIGEFYKPFEAGQRLDLRIGTTRKTMDQLLDGRRQLSSLESYGLILQPDGRFMAGTVLSSTLEGGKTSGPVQGQYHFDGHAVTLLLDSGEVIYGFGGWLPYENEETMSYRSVININGWIYTAYCEGRSLCK
ncbi:hypothetical protein [Henriciella sp.]|uniref:hypothetical protein n=1 Tax=Henriciella sp. TaxID=1968823 RepID=UPI0026282FD7|nr:hypothetical protein [Henriciella sp.]